jgi:hypothetical protein
MFIPFPTAVLAENLGGSEVRTAVAFYCGTFVFGSAAFNLLVAAISRGQLCDAQAIARVRRGYRITFVVYLAATGIALVAPYVALAINIAVRIHLLRIRYQRVQSFRQSAPHLTREHGADRGDAHSNHGNPSAVDGNPHLDGRPYLVPIHMLIGIAFVLAMWVLA